MQYRISHWFCLIASAITLSLAAPVTAQVNFDWVTVGDIGNAADTLTMTKCPGSCTGDGTTGYGSVDYEFRIATTHVTTAQYVEFLNSVDPVGDNELKLYDSRMETFLHPVSGLNKPAWAGGIELDSAAADGSKFSVKNGHANYPASWVSWVSAARFVNWISNGQGSGDTESGVYNFLPATTNDPIPEREPESTVFLPNENEFYKAAYYDPAKNGGAGGYWQYGTQSDTAPTSEGPAGGTNSANYALTDGNPGPSGDTYWQQGGAFFDDDFDGYRTDVGAYSNATSHYGLHDVEGASYQWLEAKEPNRFNPAQELPAFRGGSWFFGSDGSGAAYRNAGQFFATGSTSLASNSHGIRLASLPLSGLPCDLDGDGDCDGDDIEILVDNVVAGSATSSDIGAWLTDASSPSNPYLGGTKTFVIGDANLDGTVDSTDLGLLLNSFGSTNLDWVNGNMDGSGTIDSTDLGQLLNNFGATSAATAVPEPTGLAMAFMAMLLMGVARRK